MERREEHIGRVRLDLSRYGGADLYCDGEIEQTLLDWASRLEGDALWDQVGRQPSWPAFYHFSPQRENVVEWLPIDEGQKVLEVGSGPGAITGALARKGAALDCVDLSLQRSRINAHRHRQHPYTIHVGNFLDIEPDLPRDYQWILLIGVFEYAQGYMGGERPYEEFLDRLLAHLAPGGRLVIAIENRYGLKYFAGCKEDHGGRFFEGIENYPYGGVAKTFGRRGLERMFASAGVERWQFYYPYPDYKFMELLHSDARLPRQGELSRNLRNFDQDRIRLFDEKKAFDGIAEEGNYPDFANSYLAVLGPPLDVEYVKYSNDRAAAYRIKTQMRRRPGGELRVEKRPLHREAWEHIRGLESTCAALEAQCRGRGLRPNACRLEEGAGGPVAVLEFEEGETLAKALDRAAARLDRRSFVTLVEMWRQRIQPCLHGDWQHWDLAFSNVLLGAEEWVLLDYEWRRPGPYAWEDVAGRGLYLYLLERDGALPWDVEGLLADLGISGQRWAAFAREEAGFQAQVMGGERSLGDWRACIGGRVWEWKEENFASAAERLGPLQIYVDKGKGFGEGDSIFPRELLEAEAPAAFAPLGRSYAVEIGPEVRRLRIDPAMEACMVRLTRLTLGGRDLLGLSLGGNGKGLGGDGQARLWAFPGADPQWLLDSGLARGGGLLEISLEIWPLPEAWASSLAVKKKGWW